MVLSFRRKSLPSRSLFFYTVFVCWFDRPLEVSEITDCSAAFPMSSHGRGDDDASIAGTELFGPHAPSTLTMQSLLDLKARHVVPDEIEVVLPNSSQSPELVRPGYCCAYAPYFVSCGLNFPILSYLFEALDRLGLTFSHMCPNFVRHVVGISNRTRVHRVLTTSCLAPNSEFWKGPLRETTNERRNTSSSK